MGKPTAIGRAGRACLGVALLAVALFPGCRIPPVPSPGEVALPSEALALPLPRALKGDLDEMRKRRLVRILVAYNRSNYFIDQGVQRGTAVEAGQLLERWLNRASPKAETERITVAFFPTARDRLLPALEEGLGDIAVGALTITAERRERVDFSEPVARSVREVVVTGPDGPALRTLDDLGGQEVHVRRSSSYWEHLTELNARRKAARQRPVVVRAVDENLEDEDILEMVHAGLLGVTVVDDFTASLWRQVFDGITVREDLAVHEGGELAWAVRKGSPLLLAELNAFVRKHRVGTSLGNQILGRYYRSTRFVRNATSAEEMRKFEATVELFRRSGAQYAFDHLLLMAQGYQESRLDQSARSPSGAVGIMQVLPGTAAASPIGIQGVEASAERNVEAGVKYLRHLANTYLDDPDIDPTNRTLLSFAAYNAGPGNLQKFRSLARRSGLDPNVWFRNVEFAAARVVGQETVRYVANIYKYYLAYQLAQERIQSKPAVPEAP
jgi:membrane-bound lytic murein transglycosylase MltF